jgi:hypothetical protein
MAVSNCCQLHRMHERMGHTSICSRRCRCWLCMACKQPQHNGCCTGQLQLTPAEACQINLMLPLWCLSPVLERAVNQR